MSTCLFTWKDVQDQLVVNLLPQPGHVNQVWLEESFPSPASLESINPWHPVTHFSRCLVEVVKESYARADIECDKDKRAHEVWAIATSWAYINQVRLEDIPSAASWRSVGVFQGSYLCSISSNTEGMSTIGPVIAKQHVICTKWQLWLPDPCAEQSGYTCLNYLIEITWLLPGISVVGTKDEINFLPYSMHDFSLLCDITSENEVLTVEREAPRVQAWHVLMTSGQCPFHMRIFSPGRPCRGRQGYSCRSYLLRRYKATIR